MTDTTYTSFEPPPEAVLLTAATTNYTYYRTNSGDDMFVVTVGDPNLGSFCLCLAPGQAYDLAQNLLRMCTQIEPLRTQRDKETGQ